MNDHAVASQSVKDIQTTQAARDVGDWLLAEMPSSVREVNVYPGSASGLAFEFENGGWNLVVDVSRDGMMLFSGEQIAGIREIEPYPFDACSPAMVGLISGLSAANDR